MALELPPSVLSVRQSTLADVATASGAGVLRHCLQKTILNLSPPSVFFCATWVDACAVAIACVIFPIIFAEFNVQINNNNFVDTQDSTDNCIFHELLEGRPPPPPSPADGGDREAVLSLTKPSSEFDEFEPLDLLDLPPPTKSTSAHSWGVGLTFNKPRPPRWSGGLLLEELLPLHRTRGLGLFLCGEEKVVSSSRMMSSSPSSLEASRRPWYHSLVLRCMSTLAWWTSLLVNLRIRNGRKYLFQTEREREESYLHTLLCVCVSILHS